MLTEIDIINHLRLTAAEQGITLWRNNTGAVSTPNGRVVRFGLANDSARVNQQIKSSDLIGITPTIITNKQIGRQLAVFTAIEVKRPGWKLNPKNKKEMAQAAFLRFIKSQGGVAYFSTGDLIFPTQNK